MTTISLNRRRRPPWRTLLSTLFLLLALLVVGVFRAPLTSALWHILSPIALWRDSLGSGSEAELRAELASTTALIADRNALYEENLYLKSLLGRSSSPRVILAGVLTRPPQTPYDTLMVDAGSQEGVAPGVLVYAGSVEVGRVREVYDTTARVVLFSSPGSEYQALLAGRIPVTLVGQGAGSLSAEVPASTAVSLGDSVVAQGIDGGFVGSVSFIEAPTGDSFKTLYVHIPVNLFSLRFVEIHR